MSSPRNTAKFGLAIVFGVILIGYILFQSKNLIEGPVLTITSPTNGETFSTSLITVEGTAKNIRSITLDDRPIFIDNTGHFVEKLLLPSGYSIMKLEVEDRFGKTREKFIHVYETEESISPSQTSYDTGTSTSSSSSTTTNDTKKTTSATTTNQ